MATANPSPTPAKPLSGGDPMAVLWGGAMLVLFALWLGKNHAEAARPVLFAVWVFGLGGILLGLFTALKLRQAERASDQTRIEGQRRLLGIVLTIAGLVLAASSGYLAWKLHRAGLGESVGLGLFAIVSLIAGLTYLKPASSTEFMHKVLASLTLIQNALLLLGVAGIIVFLWLAFLRKVGAGWFPELGSLLFESLLCATCAFWLISSQPAERNEFAVRCLLLIFGAVTGFILVALAGMETFVWRQDVLLGGVSAWQGENGYKFWICAYLFLVGLLLMFTSLLLARSEIRTHAVLRQSLYGYNAVVTGLLLLVFLGTLNVVCYAMFPMTFDWTQTRSLTTLSPDSKRMLASLKEPTTVYVLLPRQDEVFRDIESMLNNCAAVTDKLRAEYISPDTDSKAFNRLAMRFPELLPSKMEMQQDEAAGGRGLLVVYGQLPADFSKKPPHQFIPERKLSERSRDQNQEPGERPKTTLVFKGEIELMNALKHLVYGKEDRKIYFLQGDEELDINSTQKRRHFNYTEPMSSFGAASLIDRLKKDNYKVSGLSFRRKLSDKATDIVYVNETGEEKRVDVPDNAWAVVIAGASKELTKDTIDALERFVENKNGKLLVTFDVVADRSEGFPLKKAGLEKFLLKYGVNVSDSFVMRVIDDPNDDASVILCTVPPTAENEYAKQFSRSLLKFASVRVVKPGPKGGKFNVETLLEADPRYLDYLEETSIRNLQNPVPFLQILFKQGMLEKRMIKEPLPVAVTVSEGEKPRMVVFGDTDFLSNTGITPSRDGDLNYSLFVSAMEWMAERQALVGPQSPTAKVAKNFSLPTSVTDAKQGRISRMIFMPAWFMLIGSVGLGIGIWLVRRR